MKVSVSILSSSIKAAILKQVRDQEFDKEIRQREKAMAEAPKERMYSMTASTLALPSTAAALVTKLLTEGMAR